MGRSRSFYEADRVAEFTPTKYKTDENQKEINCSICGDMLYISSTDFESVAKAIEATSENPFVCAECLDESQEAAYR